MGKFMLPAGFLLLLSSGALAQELADASVPPTTAPVVNPSTTTTTTPVVNPSATTTTTPAVNPSATPTSTPVVNPSNTTTTTVTSTTVNAAPAKNQPIDCQYKIPAETTQIDPNVIIKWSEKAAQQSFDFESSTLDNQLLALKACYTDQGWLSFNEALQKSGNLNAITTQKLNVSSMVNGQSTAKEVKASQWKVTVPLQVVYQNEKEKVTQLLNIELLVGRKLTGDLGIMQMIASPLETKAPKINDQSSPNPN